MSGENGDPQLTAPDKQTNKQNGQILNKTVYIQHKDTLIYLFLNLPALSPVCTELNAGQYSLTLYGTGGNDLFLKDSKIAPLQVDKLK